MTLKPSSESKISGISNICIRTGEASQNVSMGHWSKNLYMSMLLKLGQYKKYVQDILKFISVRNDGW